MGSGTRSDVDVARRRTRPRNIPLAMTMKNVGNGPLRMELRDGSPINCY